MVLHAPILITAKIMSKKKAKGKSVRCLVLVVSLLFVEFFVVLPLPFPKLTVAHCLLDALSFDACHPTSAALAASTVKIAGRDVLATWKVLLSLVATPILYTFYATLATFLAYKWDAPSLVVWWMPAFVFVGLPFGAMSALKFGEAAMDVLKYVTVFLECSPP